MTKLRGPRKLYKHSLVLFLILPIIYLQFNLVIARDFDDDSLENALEAIERRQRALQMSGDEYGQPENIGYGYQKTLGFFDPELIRHQEGNIDPEGYGRSGLDADDFPSKRERSNFRERATAPTDSIEYLQALRNLWETYQKTHSRALDLEDLTDEEVAELLASMENEVDTRYTDLYAPRSRRNYRIFDGYNEVKRSPSFGQGLYGKRSSQRLGYESPPGDAFLYSLKWVNPSMNREGVEALRGAEPWVEDRDQDALSVINRPRYRRDEAWMSRPLSSEQLTFGNVQRSSSVEKKSPVKRNTNRVRKQTTNEEVKGIFSANKEKIELEAKKPEEKKVVRREEPKTNSGEIANLFHVQKKSIDWSKHFGVNKRMYSNPFDTRVFNTKRKLSDNLDAVENRIGGVEDRILEDAVKYTGANSDGNFDAVRGEVIRRLEAAYSLEKMRAALEEFRKTVSTGVTEAVPEFSTVPKGLTEASIVEGDKMKRVAVKKEGVVRPEDLEFLNWQSSAGSSGRTGECPLLQRLVANCIRMEELMGKFAELLTPACTLHQICYACGSEIGVFRRTTCDRMFLSEAQHLCDGKPECVGGARESVLALRESQDTVPDPGTCRGNPCVAEHFMTSPSGIVSMTLP